MGQRTASAASNSSSRISAAGRAVLESLHTENRASAARLRACHELYEICEDEHVDQLFAAGYDPEHDDRKDFAMVDPYDVACAEIVAAYGVHVHRARAILTLARTLVEKFPRILEAMESGQLDERTADLLAKQMRTVDAWHRPAIQKDVMDWLMEAIASGQRPGRSAILNKTDRIIEKHDPEGVLHRRNAALLNRNVQVRRGQDGMATLHAHLTSAEASTIYTALQEAVRQQISGEKAARVAAASRNDTAETDDQDQRSAGQRRADALVDALIRPRSLTARPVDDRADSSHPADQTDTDTTADTPLPSQIRPHITVLAPLGPDGEPEVYLPRGGPATIDALIALLSRSVGATLSVPDTEPGAADTPHSARRYRISTQLARRIRLRDGTCRHPGCSVPADDCDIDHVSPFNHIDPDSGGPTIESNLACLCRRHHRFKTFHDWQYQLHRDGTLTVTTDTGHRITTAPDGPLARWRHKSADHARSGTDPGADPGPAPRQFPFDLLKPERTHWYRRARRLAAERLANSVARNAPPPTADGLDHDPPPF